MSTTPSVPVQPGGGSSATQQQAQEVAGQAQEKAQQAAGQVKDKLRQQVGQRSTQAGEQASTAAEDLRGVADHLRSQGKDQPAKLADQAAQRVEKVGGYLQQSDADRVLSDVEEFGRQKPWAVAAAGAALGFAASRLLKASSTERYRAASSSRPGMV